MSGSLNQVQLIGHLGADPETRRMGSGDPVVNLRIATSETWKDKTTGERKERTEWHSVVIFNENLGKVAEQYTRKGSKVFVQGKLATRKWQDQSGQDRYRTEIILERFGGLLTLLDRAERPGQSPDDYGQTRARDSGAGYGAAKSGTAAPGAGAPRSYGSDLDDDIPFAPELRG